MSEISEFDVDRILSNAGVRISCAMDGECSPDKLLAALSREINIEFNRCMRERTAAEPHGNKIKNWDDLIALAKRNILRAKIRQEELTAAVRIYQQKRDAGIPLAEEPKESI